jgi:pimeloyl-ACP methyl ester carboxylesterase
VLVLAALLAAGTAMIDRFIFFPEKLPRTYSFDLGGNDRELTISTEDGEELSGILFAASRPRGVILYFHGNAGSLSSWRYVSGDIVPKGFDLLIIDYRGYGKSTGMISEEGLYRDAEASYEQLRSLGWKESEIIVYGRSLGTGVALHLATTRKIRALVLEAPFTTLPDLASHLLPIPVPAFYIPYRFDNLGRAPDVKVPTLLLHGTRDELIPPDHSQKILDALACDKRLVLIRGGEHNDLTSFPEYHEALDAFLKSLTAAVPADPLP